jgi:anti-sigma B factor antagonist
MLSATCDRLRVEKTIDGIAVAVFSDAELVDGRVIGEVEDALCEIAEGLGAASLLLNFERVRLMSTVMLGVLVRFSVRLAAIGGRLKLCCVAPNLQEIFRITRYDRFFETHADEMAALDSF